MTTIMILLSIALIIMIIIAYRSVWNYEKEERKENKESSEVKNNDT